MKKIRGGVFYSLSFVDDSNGNNSPYSFIFDNYSKIIMLKFNIIIIVIW